MRSQRSTERGAWGRRTRHDYAQRLRAFFLFAEMRGWCRAGLAAGIVAPRFMADETVPKGLRRDDVVRLLTSIGGDRPVDKRDRAVLMLFIAYGLRAGEVGGLRLDDLDWEAPCSGPLPETGPDPPMAAVAGRGARHPALYQGGAAVRLRAQSLLHDARADPAARPESLWARWSATGWRASASSPADEGRTLFGMPRPSTSWIRARR